MPLDGATYDLLASLPHPIGGGSVFDVTQDGLIRAMQAATKAAGIELHVPQLPPDIEINWFAV